MIRLHEIYQGKPSNEQPILPGHYAEDDERLFGLAEYLLANGFAVYVNTDEAVVADALFAEAEAQVEIEQLRRETELLETANRNRVEHDESLRNPRGKNRR